LVLTPGTASWNEPSGPKAEAPGAGPPVSEEIR